MGATLVIDTSFGHTVGIVGHAPRHDPDSRSHVERLQPSIDQALNDAGLEPGDISRIVVGTGPAPFTGLRAGIVAARAIAYATGAELLGQNVLEPQAVWMAGGQQPDGCRHLTLAVTDARRRQLYYALYEMRPGHALPAVIMDRDIASPGVIAHRVNERITGRDRPGGGMIVVDVCGTGAGRYRSALMGIAALGEIREGTFLAQPGGEGLAAMEALALAHRDAGDDTGTEPLYLRRPDVDDPAPLKTVTAPRAPKTDAAAGAGAR